LGTKMKKETGQLQQQKRYEDDQREIVSHWPMYMKNQKLENIKKEIIIWVLQP
jgi:hypothetical protein